MIRKFAEVAGRLLKADERIVVIRNDLAHREAVLRMLFHDLDPSIIRPRGARTKPHVFVQEEMSRLILDLLREARSP